MKTSLPALLHTVVATKQTPCMLYGAGATLLRLSMAQNVNLAQEISFWFHSSFIHQSSSEGYKFFGFQGVKTYGILQHPIDCSMHIIYTCNLLYMDYTK